jgi:hypothetical protein
MNAGADGKVALEEMPMFVAVGPVDFHQMDISKADASVIYGVHWWVPRKWDGGRTWEGIHAASKTPLKRRGSPASCRAG